MTPSCISAHHADHLAHTDAAEKVAGYDVLTHETILFISGLCGMSIPVRTSNWATGTWDIVCGTIFSAPLAHVVASLPISRPLARQETTAMIRMISWTPPPVMATSENHYDYFGSLSESLFSVRRIFSHCRAQGLKQPVVDLQASLSGVL